MKPAPFAYHRPDELSQAIALLTEFDGEAKIIAGGQSLVPMLNFRLVTPRALIDLSGIPGLDQISIHSGWLHIGAMVRQRQAEAHPDVRARVPLLAEALGWVGHLPTRTRGTIGGSVALADPAAELPMVLMALDAVIHSLGPKGARVIPADQFFLSIYTTALEPDEVLTEIRIPLMKPGVGYALEEFSRRKGDFAIVGIAALVDRSVGQGQARLVACGVSGAPVRLLAAEAAFSKGPGAPAERAMRAAACAADEIEPMHSPSVTIAYRRQLTQALTERALIRAMRKTEEYVKP